MKSTTGIICLIATGAFCAPFLLSSCSHDEPPPCEVQLPSHPAGAAFVAKYIVKGTPPTCALPDFLQTGDLLHVTFAAPDAGDRAAVTLEPQWLDNLDYVYANACAPFDCGSRCGTIADGCGKTLDCGACPSGQTCGGGGPSVCGTAACTPQTCAELGASCGPNSDGCGGMLDCGSCPAPETCGGNGIPNACGHVVLDSDTSHALVSRGDFVSTTAVKNLCPIANVTPAERTFGSSPSTGAFPGVDVDAKYEWTNVSTMATETVQSTQLVGDLHFTQTVAGTTCEVDYHVIGMWPAVDCTEYNVNGDPFPNPDLCSPCADPGKGVDAGSGIDPSFPVECVSIFTAGDPFAPDRYWCMLKSNTDPPQLLASPTACP